MTSQFIGCIAVNSLLFLFIALLNRKRVIPTARTNRKQPRDTRGRFIEQIRWVTELKGGIV